MLALASPEVEVLGITTVEGNRPVAETTENALRVVELLGRKILVVDGDPPRDAYPSDRVRTRADDAVRAPTDRLDAAWAVAEE